MEIYILKVFTWVFKEIYISSIGVYVKALIGLCSKAIDIKRLRYDDEKDEKEFSCLIECIDKNAHKNNLKTKLTLFLSKTHKITRIKRIRSNRTKKAGITEEFRIENVFK